MGRNSIESPARFAAIAALLGVAALLLSAPAPARAAFHPFLPALSQEGAFNDPCGVAADSNGDLYVAPYNEQTVKIYDPSGAFLTAFATSGNVEGPCALAVGPAGDVYVNGWGTDVVKYKPSAYPPSGTTTYAPDTAVNGSGALVSSGATSVAVNPANGNVYVAEGGHVSSYQPDGTLISDAIGAGVAGATYYGVDVYGANGNVYVTDVAHNKAYILDPAGATVLVEIGGSDSDEGAFTGMEYSYLAVDQSNGHVLVSDLAGHGVVDEFDAGGSYVTQLRHGFEDALPSDIAVDGSAGTNRGNVYVTSGAGEGGSVYAFGPLAAGTPPIVTIDDPSVSPESAHIDATIDSRGEETTWRVEVSTDPGCAGGFSGEPAQTIPAGETSSVAVEWDLEGLQPHQHYCVRIRAANGTGVTRSEVKAFTTGAVLPSGVETFVAPRLDSSVRLNARLNPEGDDLTYRFEYSADGGASWQALPELTDTSDAREQIVVAEELAGLQPGTTYSYRLIFENSAGTGAGGELTFTTRTSAEAQKPSSCPNDEVRVAQRTTYLGECRGLELVNNPDKGNQNFLALEPADRSYVSPDGERALWQVLGGAPGAPNGTENVFLSQRTPEGWRSQTALPTRAQQDEAGLRGNQIRSTTPDLTSFTFQSGGISTSALIQTKSDQSFRILANTLGPGGRRGSSLPDETEDGSHVVFVNAATGQLEDAGDGSPEVVSVMPTGTPAPCPLGMEGQSFVGGGSVRGAAPQGRPGYHMIDTSDASIVYFEAQPEGNCNGAYGLYVRDRASATTTLIDAGSEGFDNKHDPQFIRATPDGRHGYFVTNSQLESADQNNGADVYRWDQEVGAATCLTCVVPDANLLAGEVQHSSVLVSDDFSHIYFESKSRLVPNKGAAGEANVYVLEDGQVRFVADPNAFATEAQPSALERRLAFLSSDGNSLFFKTPPKRGLTADTVDPTCVGSFGSSAPCQQLYRYDDRERSLECISCQRGGATTHMAEPRFKISADGSTVAFGTEEALVPADVNRDLDLYEWHDGRVSLLGDGVSAAPNGQARPFPVGIDSSGDNIFVGLLQPGVTGFEQDEQLNLYDARVGGGFPPPAPPAHCSEESCQGPLQAPPPYHAPASTGFQGAGNEQARSGHGRRACKKRKKAKGRCASRHRHRRHGHGGQAGVNSGRTR